MESDTSAEIIMQNPGIQQEKDACKELMLKKKAGVIAGSKFGTSLQYDRRSNCPPSPPTVLFLLAACYRLEMG